MTDINTPTTIAPGIIVDFLGGNCPVYGEGTIDGERFTFKARGTTLRLDTSTHNLREAYQATPEFIAQVQADNATIGNPAHSEETIASFAAGWIDIEQAQEAIVRLAGQIRAMAR